MLLTLAQIGPRYLFRYTLQVYFHFVVATKGIFPILPGTERVGQVMFPSVAFLIASVLPIISRQQMREVGIIDVAVMKCFRGRSLEGIGRSLEDEGSQERTVAISKQHS
jgi:hypothetical protein